MSHKTAATVAHTIGIDTGKSTLHLIGFDEFDRPRRQEAGIATHYLARELSALGHDIGQVPPVYAKPFRQGSGYGVISEMPVVRFCRLKAACKEALSYRGFSNLLWRRRRDSHPVSIQSGVLCLGVFRTWRGRMIARNTFPIGLITRSVVHRNLPDKFCKMRVL